MKVFLHYMKSSKNSAGSVVRIDYNDPAMVIIDQGNQKIKIHHSDITELLEVLKIAGDISREGDAVLNSLATEGRARLEEFTNEQKQ